MLPLVRLIFRPAVLIVISVLLVAAAVFIVFPYEAGSPPPQRLPLRPGDSEIAFLSPATSTTAWDRFVQTVRRSGDRLRAGYPGLKVRESQSANSAAAEVALEWPDGRRLVFRWYKLTSDWTPDVWIKALLRPPYPLAIIGGNNSHWARELAIALNRETAEVPARSRPLLLVTFATADHVTAPDAPESDEAGAEVALAKIYPERTYRFCFTNRQMATAVTQFLWAQDDLRPEAEPVYLVRWTDDSYSRDLCAGYLRVLDRRAMRDVVQQMGYVLGSMSLAQPVFTLPSWHTLGVTPGDRMSFSVLTGVGSFASPNPYEAQACRWLINDVMAKPNTTTRKRLLVVTGQAGPSRRFLRDLARTSPDAARSLTVASGDSIAFNTVYRDRMVTWPIQDLPFNLAFFCHRNPIDPEAGFRSLGAEGTRPAAQSGTEDLLLYADIVEAVALAFGTTPMHEASALAAGLESLHQADGQLNTLEMGRPLFSTDPERHGMRNGGTGEHVVCLRPRYAGDNVLPEATIEVWCRLTDIHGIQTWFRVGERLTVPYVEGMAHGERTHGGR